MNYESFLSIVDSANDTLWTVIVIPLLVGCALYFTWNLRGVQFTGIREMIHNLLHDEGEEVTNRTHHKHISSFQAFAVSLSSRVGTGNLAGVASAIFVGGPGAVFWMWVMALFGAATAFMEATLAQLFKRRGEESFYGGPAYYMQHGLGRRWMGILFAALMIFTFGLSNQIVQSNTLCTAISDAAGWDMRWVAATLTLMTLIIIFGGIQRIARFCAVVVPFMAVGYLLLAIYIMTVHISHVPEVLALIVKSAFGWHQAAGGAVGIAVMQGIRRGLFSNEAGEGSAPNAAATAAISHPVKQGLLQSFGVFVDTIVICTCTALIILLSGLYNGEHDGILLTSRAMSHHLGSMGAWYLTAAIILFAYSTIIANYFYGETNVRFITEKPWALLAFRLASGVTVMAGGLMTLQQSWSIVDLAMGLITIVNLIAVILLSRYVFRLLRDYREQRRAGQNPTFHRSMFPEADLEAWE
ncbi:MAG: alanine:cation symporter family protein [Bacteroidaceae bacterium]|nr:alanine:cation symporter family protein [Bacteroidaceae bacterium]